MAFGPNRSRGAPFIPQQQTMQQFNQPQVPQTGLIGSEQALQRGLAGGLQALDVGSQGLDIQAALAGLSGAPAQAQAFQNFQASPGQDFLRQQGEQSVLRNASAIGGLGGGNVRRELQRFGTGVAAQDFANQFNRGQQVIGAQQGPASQAANFAFGTGQGLAQGRTQAGRDIAQQQTATTSALSNLINQQGAGAADIIGGGGANIANLLQGFGGAQGGSQEQLAAILANLATQQGTASASLPSSAQFLNNTGTLGGIGQAASGAGGLLTGLEAAGIIGASDRRLKTNIKKIGEHKTGLNIYSWDWKPIADVVDGIKMTAGFMADEVEKLMPKAVILDKSGYLKVNYGMVLNGGSIRHACGQ